ncbi:MAG TPA: hypothetical protein PL033_19320 [Candidatus Brocadiia bacterium]|nr:hypothetical protein [Candidatus Brocadiia bacterium]
MADPDGYIRFRCKNCFKRLKIKAEVSGGDAIPCPFCGNTVVIPFGEGAQAELGDELAPHPTGGTSQNVMDVGGGTEQIGAPEPPRRPLPSRGPIRKSGDDRTLKMRSTSSGLGWRPQLVKRDRIKDIDDLHKSMIHVMDENLAQAHSVLLDERIPMEEKLAKLQNIGKQRETNLRKKIIQYRDQLRDRLRRMMSDPRKMGPSGMREITELKSDIEAVDLFTSFVLQMRLLPEETSQNNQPEPPKPKSF